MSDNSPFQSPPEPNLINLSNPDSQAQPRDESKPTRSSVERERQAGKSTVSSLLEAPNVRKSKSKAKVASKHDSRESTPAAMRASLPALATAQSNDDSPFVRPPSPSMDDLPQFSQSFFGGGSMRAGTQTLIQALQAIPWMEDPDHDDEVLNHGLTAESGGEGSSLEDGARLASSIHAIHRPLARSRRSEGPTFTPVDEDPLSEDTAGSDDEADGEDFEDSTPRPPHVPHPDHSPSQSPSNSMRMDKSTFGSPRSHAGSMATVRFQRRARLAEKLRDVFELKGIEEVVAEMPCWLLRSVLLQGYIYLTNSYLCFFAHMPSRGDQILKSGSLYKKTQRTKRWLQHWFVLKNDALSWYQSSADPYFPHGIVDLRYAMTCEPVNDKDIRLRTNQKTVLLSAESRPNRDEWIKAIRKVMFKAQNMGESVKIAIPYSAILDVEKSSAIDFSETIEIKVVESEEQYSVDSYFFAYFQDLPVALEQIRDAVRSYRSLPATGSPKIVMDTTAPRASLNLTGDRPAGSSSTIPAAEPPKLVHGFSFTSLLRPFSEGGILSRTPIASPVVEVPKEEPEQEEFTHVSRRGNLPITASMVTQSIEFKKPSASGHVAQESSSSGSTVHHRPSSSVSSTRSDHTYPPSISNSYVGTKVSPWSVGVPSWLRGPSLRMFGGYQSVPTNEGGVSEVYSRVASAAELGHPGWDEDEGGVSGEMVEKFRTAFAFDERETLLGYSQGYIFRLLPLYGRMYVSTNFFCFKSSGPLTSRTKMILPIRDMLATEKSKATRFGYHGLIVIVKGHEELFFEFGAEAHRNAVVALLEKQMEDIRRSIAAGNIPSSQGKRPELILEDFSSRSSLQLENSNHSFTSSGRNNSKETNDDGSSHGATASSESMTDSLPAVMFTSNSSTFLTFKPDKALHFTFLTIGSRGDVQPYIALAKGLQADGHRCRIATHGEFKEWIESHGLEYAYVGGDPAELMKICVENGMFTLSFMKEVLQKFRGWFDDLLKTSWEACQGTDVLVECPSAMGGVHIAEALRIPYFRAFTMMWTRTRAYPHAFAVPERKMGGSYNYMTYVMFDQVFWRATAGQINRWRKNMLKLGSTSLDKMEQHKIPFLYNFSPVMVPPPLDWPEWIRVTGYWFLQDADVSAKKWVPPSSLVQFIESAHKQQKKVVYIGFGSIVVSNPKEITRAVIGAVQKSGVYAILSKGWSDRLQDGSAGAGAGGGAGEEEEIVLPKQIYPVSAIPHDWLFPRIDAACHHGGAGTTGASLRAGIPTIIRPFFGDQFFWADRVEALGCGTGLRELTMDTLAAALTSATTDPKQKERAKAIGEQIRSEDGVGVAIESIYRNLDYARSLVKPYRPSSSPSGQQTSSKPGHHRTSSSTSTASTSSLATASDLDIDDVLSTMGNTAYVEAGSGKQRERRRERRREGEVRRTPSEEWSVISGDDGLGGLSLSEVRVRDGVRVVG